jgi:outer membrane protein OmpA-like peptidoglycan-associated protein
MTPRTRAAPAVGVVAALLLAGSASASDQVPTPSSAALAQSVSVFQTDGSVTYFDLQGSVTPLESQRQEAGETVLSLASDILFAFGSSRLPPPATVRIGELVASLPRGAPVAVTGHTDSIGDPARNRTLSQQRAQAVAAAVAAARPDLQLVVEGRGDTQPVAPHTSGGQDDPAGRALNRRVEIRFAG